MLGVRRTTGTTSSPHAGERQDHPLRMYTMCYSIVGVHYMVVFHLMTDYDYYTRGEVYEDEETSRVSWSNILE